eukprot:973576-Lingulodinium_polyedra.AAC.1
MVAAMVARGNVGQPKVNSRVLTRGLRFHPLRPCKTGKLAMTQLGPLDVGSAGAGDPAEQKSTATPRI